LWCRGKGDYFRLGHGSDAHVRKPQLVEGLKGKKIVHVSVGALHCLAVTDQGMVRSNKQLPLTAHSNILYNYWMNSPSLKPPILTDLYIP
jgi:hypothetical protein